MATGLDLGLTGQRAIVCGSTKGLGNACAAALAAAGAAVIVNGRSQESVDAAVAALAATGGQVAGVAADVTTAAGRDRLLAACADPDILVTNAAGPPPGSLDDWDEAAWERALGANMIAPALLIRAVVPGMRGRGWGRILNITSGAVKAPIAILGLSNGARSGLTGFVAGLARQVARDGVTINNLLPGFFATDRLRSLAETRAKAAGVEADVEWARMAAENPTGRIGRPEEFGAACAFLASAHAGYINGQNLLLDGGAYPGTM